ILIPYLNFHYSDPVHDRLREQWGFFYFHAAPEGLLYPPQSLVNIILSAFRVKFETLEVEKYMNIGLVTSLILLAMLVTWIVRLFKKRSAEPNGLRKPLSVILIASIILFVYAANTSLVPLPETSIQEHLGPLLMFKAVSRIGWPVYFALTLWSVIFFDRWLARLTTVMIANAILLVAAGTWAWEIHTYVGSHYHDCFHENFLRQELADGLIKNLDEHHIELSTFQAMLVLPKMQAWTDNFLSDLNWASQFFSTRISAATGLPMINAMLSRMSIGQSAEAIQMLSNPLIRRDLVRKLPNQKDILLLVGGGHPPLKEGEDFLVHVSTPLFESPDYSLYRLRLKDLEDNVFMEEARTLALQNPPVSPEVIHLGFDDPATQEKFYGTGARLMPKGTTTVVAQALPCNRDTNYVFSAWTQIGHIKPGVGDWYITLSDSTGQVVMPATRIETRKSNDIQDMWIRSEMQFPVAKGTRIKADFVTDHDLY
ncbi:MAG TPA: hypothetical protein VJ508_02660, partial [Saprospiraceae bacterium]|nr:hypothetical protein [Saprospiraceae bacterium]